MTTPHIETERETDRQTDRQREDIGHMYINLSKGERKRDRQLYREIVSLLTNTVRHVCFRCVELS